MLGRGIVIVAVAAVSVGCCGPAGYEGDGKAAGFGGEFEVQLGTIDATAGGNHVYRMSGLSRHDLVAGFRTTRRSDDAIIAMSLANSHGQTVIQEEAKLGDWVWSYALGPEPRDYFVYRRGESKDVPIGGGSVRVEPVGVRPDHGWGSYFHPSSSETYTLTVRVVHPSREATILTTAVKCAEVYTP